MNIKNNYKIVINKSILILIYKKVNNNKIIIIKLKIALIQMSY